MKKSKLIELIEEAVTRKLNEIEEKKEYRFKFSNDNYSAAISILSKNKIIGTSAAPPVKDYKYYVPDEHWNSISVFKKNDADIIELILNKNNIQFKKEIKKPMEYKIFNHGGYLD